MKRPITNALVTLMMVFIVATTSHAVTLSPAHTFNTTADKCAVCHASAAPTIAAANNVCLVCHKTGSAYTSDRQFFKGDMANPFGTTVEDDTNKSYTHSSHEWSASDNNPAAGALPPVSSNMYTVTSYIGNLSCNRCHAVHSDPTDGSYKPLLRVSKTNDALCVDCHRLRNTSTHLTGTHPVNINYSTSKLTIAAPRTLASTPINSNPANTTSDLKLQLKSTNNVVLCTTCHGVHYTDSSSKTFDTRSTSVRALLMPSKGYLLKTDYRYSNYTSVNSPNICTNCHTNKFTHNGGGQNVKCTDCHSAHVDYDFKALTDQDRIPNVFMIKRYMNWSSPTGWRDNKKLPKKLVAQLQYSTLQTYFQYTGAQRQYMRMDGKGVCQSCHAVPSAGLNANGKTYPEEHGSGNQNATANDCKSCHNHYTPAPQGSFAASCTNCHGQPPQAATAAPGYTGNEGASAHMKHADKAGYSYACQECHYPGAPANLHITAPHTYQDVFNTGYTSGILASKHGATPKYNTATGTCSTSYCHSNGAPRGLAFKMYTSPAWFNGKITTCDKCHEASPTTNVHASHVTTSDHLAFSCETCHSATVSGSTTIKDKSKHIDDTKEIVFNSAALPFVLSGSYDGAGKCSTIYCHSDGSGTNYKTPNWTDPATGACGTSCHDTSTRATGAHQAHLSLGNAYGPQLNQFQVPKEAACVTCHLNHTTNHINGRYDTANQGTCSLSCHKNGIGSATWTSGRTGITCESCHAGALSVIKGVFKSYTAPDKSLAATKGHGMTSSSTGVVMQYACTVCHNPDATHINPPVRDGRLVASLTGSLNTSCTFCHNDPVKVTTLFKLNLSSHVLDKNASPTASSCSSCHDLHGTSNKFMIRDFINGQAVSFKNTTGFVSTTPNADGKYTGLCQVCHTLTSHYTNSAKELSHKLNTNCLNCHKHTDNIDGLPAAADFYAFKPTNGGCSDCHGYPPVQSKANIGVHGNYSGAMLENYSGGGGAHNVAGHIAITAIPADTWSNCVTCHYGTDSDPNHMTRDKSKPSNIHVTVDPKYKFNSQLQIRYSSNQVDKPLRNSTGTCTNVSCHFQPTPRWSSVR